jgi:hypothetical protein
MKMSSNPFLSQWLSAANAAAGAWRGFWTAEFSRQQTALATEWQRQALQFWTQAFSTTTRGAFAAPAQMQTAATVAESLPVPLPVAAPEAPETQDEPAPAAKPAPTAKRPMAARVATHRVKAQTKRGPARSPSRRGPAATRH